MAAQSLQSRSEWLHWETASRAREFSGKFASAQYGHGVWFARYLHGHCDDFLLGWPQKVCSYSTSRFTELWPGDFQQGDRQNYPQCFDAGSIRRDVLGALAAKLFFLDRSG